MKLRLLKIEIEAFGFPLLFIVAFSIIMINHAVAPYLAIGLTTFSSTLSICGSLAIVLSSYKSIDSIYQRLIFIISMADIVSSVSFIIQPFMIPSIYQPFLPFAFGNHATCSFGGFLMVFGPLIITFYSFYLSLFFYMKIKYNINENIMTKKRYPLFAHIIAWTISVGIPLAGVIVDGYGLRFPLYVCALGACPIFDPGCQAQTTSQRIAVSLYVIYVSITLLLALSSVCCCILLYHTVRQQLYKNRQYEFQFSNRSSSHNTNSTSSTSNNNDTAVTTTATPTTDPSPISPQKEQQQPEAQSSILCDVPDHQKPSPPMITLSPTKKYNNTNNKINEHKIIAVRNQAILYSLAYWNSFVWMFIIFVTSILFNKHDRHNDHMIRIINFLIYAFSPLQGFCNFLIYTRPRYLEYRYNYPQHSKWYAIKQALSLKPVDMYHRRRYSSMIATTRMTPSSLTAANISNYNDKGSVDHSSNVVNHHHDANSINNTIVNYDDSDIEHVTDENDNKQSSSALHDDNNNIIQQNQHHSLAKTTPGENLGYQQTMTAIFDDANTKNIILGNDTDVDDTINREDENINCCHKMLSSSHHDNIGTMESHIINTIMIHFDQTTDRTQGII